MPFYAILIKKKSCFPTWLEIFCAFLALYPNSHIVNFKKKLFCLTQMDNNDISPNNAVADAFSISK